MEDPIEMGEEALDMEYPEASKKKVEEGMIDDPESDSNVVDHEMPRGLTREEFDRMRKNEAQLAQESYTREEMLRMREDKIKPGDGTCVEFDVDAYCVVQQDIGEGLYAREDMERLRRLPGYIWRSSVFAMQHWAERQPRRSNEVLSSEYWIWHNVNGKNAFARYFGSFPFYLPHFDPAGFEEVAVAGSPVCRYLHSKYFQSHLAWRKYYYGKPEGEAKVNYERIVAGCPLMAEWPLDGYSREAIVALNTNRRPHNELCIHFDSKSFFNVMNINPERQYTTAYIRKLSTYKGYNWNLNPVENSLGIMDRYFPGIQRNKKILNTEYWIWHNVNAQQSFAVYWGFFPFHLPHFDAAAFISVARPESIVPAYLTSQLYQDHLKLRETYEGAEYNTESEEMERRRLVAEQRRAMRFPLTDEKSMVYYEDPEKKLHECSVDDALKWLSEGYFSSDMKFVVAPKGTNPREKEWAVCTLAELIERNGRPMPFVFSSEYYSEESKGVGEMEDLREEIAELTERKHAAMMSMELLKARVTIANHGIQRMMGKFPIKAQRSTQTQGEIFMEAKMEAAATSHPQFVPREGVDPFKLLRAIPKESTTRKIIGEAIILERMEQLRKRFDKCDKKVLVLRTFSLINKKQPANCRLCELKMESCSTFIEHVTCRKHMNKLPAVCAEALEFWFNAIEEVSKESGPTIPPLALLSPCVNPPNPHKDLQQAAWTMQRKLKACDKKILDGEPGLKALFNTQISCSVCVRRVFIDKPANLIAHFATSAHVAMATKNGGQMHKEVIDFWIAALDRAMISRTIDNATVPSNPSTEPANIRVFVNSKVYSVPYNTQT